MTAPATPPLVPVVVPAAVMINLDTRPDRHAAFLRRWQPQVAATGLPGPVRHPAVYEPERPATGCLQSHLQALAAAPGPLLVLEDDAVPGPDFRWPITAPADWEILWLGGQHRLRPRRAAPGWTYVADLVRTHAYIARDPQQIAALLAGAPRIDPHLSLLPVRQYAQAPFTVGQAAGRSDITGIRRPADTYWNY